MNEHDTDDRLTVQCSHADVQHRSTDTGHWCPVDTDQWCPAGRGVSEAVAALPAAAASAHAGADACTLTSDNECKQVYWYVRVFLDSTQAYTQTQMHNPVLYNNSGLAMSDNSVKS